MDVLLFTYVGNVCVGVTVMSLPLTKLCAKRPSGPSAIVAAIAAMDALPFSALPFMLLLSAGMAAMTASDVIVWDEALRAQRLVKGALAQAMFAPNGLPLPQNAGLAARYTLLYTIHNAIVGLPPVTVFPIVVKEDVTECQKE